MDAEAASLPDYISGEELVAARRQLDIDECQWLLSLGEFDRRQGYVEDGFWTCVAWLVHRCGIARATAHDKLRIAAQLRRRPLVREAFATGALSYSKVRAITRLEDADDELDRVLIETAERFGTDRLEALVRYRRRLAEQERDPSEFLRRFERRGARASVTYDGMGVLETVLPEEEHAEVMALIDARMRRAVDQSSAEDTFTTTWQRRADAIVGLIRAGAAAGDHATDMSGADRYTLNVVTDIAGLVEAAGRREVLGGPLLGLESVRRVACDCSMVRHIVAGGSEPIDIGRKTAVWNRAQRRAIRVRDGDCCRFPGCMNRITDIHHVWHWAAGGPTAVNNGALHCPRHHTLLHEGGWNATGDANGTLTYTGPRGQRVESPVPATFAAAA